MVASMDPQMAAMWENSSAENLVEKMAEKREKQWVDMWDD